MTVTKTIGSYAKTLLATLKGDQTEKLAAANERRAAQALTRQISNLTDRITTLTEKVEDAEEKLQEAFYPTYKLEENSDFCNKIKNAQDNLDKAKENLSDCQNSLDYFTKVKTDLSL